MALEYFPCYYSYGKKLAKLSDQEVGRLFRSLLKYGETGEAEELTGRESVAFDFIADDIDRAKTIYEEKCSKNKKNIEERYERIRTNTTVYERKETKDKTKDKNKTEDINPLTPFEGELRQAVSDWLDYKTEKRQGYKPTGLKSLVTQISNAAAKHGDAAVAKLIRDCMSSNYQGIMFDRLENGKTKNAMPSLQPGQAELEVVQRMAKMRRERTGGRNEQ